MNFITSVLSFPVAAALLLLSWHVDANPSIYLVEPKQEGSYFTAPNSVIAQIPLEYQLFGISQPLTQYEFCFTVKSNHFATIIVEQTCLPVINNKLILNKLKEDEYTLTYFLREKSNQDSTDWKEVPFSMTSNVFTVLSYENALPKIELPAILGDTITIIAKDETKTGELVLDYLYSKTALDISNIALCARIIDSLKNNIKLQWTCLGPNDRRLALSNLNLGKYTIDLILTDINQQRQGKNGFLLSTQLTKKIIVEELINALPTLSLYNPLQEYVVNPSQGEQGQGQYTATIQIIFQVDGMKSALQQVGVCLQIFYTETKQEKLKYSCLPITNNVITLQNVEIGDYTAQMVLAKVSNAKDYFPTSKVEFPIIVKKPIEFIPTYQWQRLHAWHTIPSGIETQ